jgi:hypothetical protein
MNYLEVSCCCQVVLEFRTCEIEISRDGGYLLVFVFDLSVCTRLLVCAN